MQEVLDDVAQFMGKYAQELVVLEVMVYPGVQGGNMCALAKLFGVLVVCVVWVCVFECAVCIWYSEVNTRKAQSSVD